MIQSEVSGVYQVKAMATMLWNEDQAALKGTANAKSSSEQGIEADLPPPCAFAGALCQDHCDYWELEKEEVEVALWEVEKVKGVHNMLAHSHE